MSKSVFWHLGRLSSSIIRWHWHPSDFSCQDWVELSWLQRQCQCQCRSKLTSAQNQHQTDRCQVSQPHSPSSQVPDSEKQHFNPTIHPILPILPVPWSENSRTTPRNSEGPDVVQCFRLVWPSRKGGPGLFWDPRRLFHQGNRWGTSEGCNEEDLRRWISEVLDVWGLGFGVEENKTWCCDAMQGWRERWEDDDHVGRTGPFAHW